LVIHPNPRGSTGYGEAFCLGIWQDWGGPDFEDVMAALTMRSHGLFDADRLGVTGWSYGGILTNHVITRTVSRRPSPAPIQPCMQPLRT
jgi:dipeptidyl aminopeptidase/acylaminoacyl peptidase